MKLHNLAITITAAAMLPIIAYAGDNMDVIRASFDRDIYREYSTRYVPATVKDADPLDAINVALLSGSDPVVASFDRDLYRESVEYKTLPVSGNTDPLNSINVVLRCENTDIINAGINPEHNHC